jgi:ATP-dependent DNA ligase
MVLQISLDDDGEKQVEVVSKHNKDFTAEVMRSLDIRDELYRLADLVPANTQFDSEWLSRRACSKEFNLPPKLFLFDILVWDGKRQTKVRYSERWGALSQILAENNFGTSVVAVDTAPDGHYESYYEEQKKIPWSEGVVCKHKDSKMVAKSNSAAENNRWFKVRYRAGADGTVLTD